MYRIKQQLKYIGAEFEGNASMKPPRHFPGRYAVDTAPGGVTITPNPKGQSFTFFYKGRRWVCYTKHQWVFFEVIDESGYLQHLYTRKSQGNYGICIGTKFIDIKHLRTKQLAAITHLPHIHRHENISDAFRKELQEYGTE